MMNISRPWFYCLSIDIASIYFNATSALSLTRHSFQDWRWNIIGNGVHGRKLFTDSLSTTTIFFDYKSPAKINTHLRPSAIASHQPRSSIAVLLLDQLDKNTSPAHIRTQQIYASGGRMGAKLKT